MTPIYVGYGHGVFVAPTSAAAPGQPTNLRLTVSPVVGTEVNLAWDRASGPVSRYQLLRDGQVLDEVVNGTTYVDDSVSLGTTYTYAVRAVGPGGTGLSSTTLNVEVPAGEFENPVFGGLGDSQTDEYQGDDERGPAEVMNWLELLVQLRGLDFGAWSDSSRGEPRREGYAYNWARSGAVMQDVLDDQVAGLAAQVSAGAVTHVILFATGNEWATMSPLYMAAIYNGNGTVTSAGTPLTTVVSTLVGQFTSAMDTMDSAIEAADLGGGMAVITPPNYLGHPGTHASFPVESRRNWVEAVAQDIYEGVLAHAATLNTAAGYTRFSVRRADHHMAAAWATGDGQFLTAAGVSLDYVNAWEYDPVDYDPYAFALEATSGSQHAGTVACGIFARTVIDALNDLAGINIATLTDSEIQIAAGAVDEPTPLDAGTIQGIPGDGQATINYDDQPSGGSGEYTVQLYRSTAEGVRGSAVSGATSLPYINTGLTNDTTYWYTLEVSDGETTEDTPQISVTPTEEAEEVEPDIFEDFSTYTSTSNMIANPRGLYSTSEDSLGGAHGEVVLDTSIGYGASDRSMRYNWFPFSTVGTGGTLQRRINYGNRAEVWVEAVVRFSANFATDHGNPSSGAAYKFLFNLIANPPSGRFDFGLNGAAGTIDFDFPSDVYSAAHMTAPYTLENTWRDEQWHVCRMHIRVSGGRGDLGEISIDGGPWYVSDGASTDRLPQAGNSGPWNTATAGVRGWAFGANLNERPTIASVGEGGQSNWWGSLKIWFTNPPSWNSGH